MTPSPGPRQTLGRRARLALAALVLPLGLGAAGCKGGLVDSPSTTVPPPNTEIQVVTGRPLRRRNGRIRRPRSRRGHSHLTDRQALWLAPSVRSALADHWRNQGEFEHASVAAFIDLGRRLTALGAPAELVAAAQRAADQETDHATRCFDLAGRYLGVEIQPGRLRVPNHRARNRELEMCALATEALRDGVLNEGYAAWLAARQAERACDRRARETLEVIARDEADHAQLSADVLTWCLGAGGSAVGDAVREAATALPARMVGCVVPTDLDARALADHGLFDPDRDGTGFTECRQEALRMATVSADA